MTKSIIDKLYLYTHFLFLLFYIRNSLFNNCLYQISTLIKNTIIVLTSTKKFNLFNKINKLTINTFNI